MHLSLRRWHFESAYQQGRQQLGYDRLTGRHACEALCLGLSRLVAEPSPVFCSVSPLTMVQVHRQRFTVRRISRSYSNARPAETTDSRISARLGYSREKAGDPPLLPCLGGRCASSLDLLHDTQIWMHGAER